MSPRPSPTPSRRPGTHLILAALSAVLVVIANVSGLAVGDDGIGYQAIADSLSKGRGLQYFLEPHGVTIWPPGFPTLMSVVSRFFSISTGQAAIALNALTAFIVVLLVHRLLLRLVGDARIRLLGTAVVALGGSTMVFGHLLMTDFAFVAVMLGLFLALANYRDAGSVRWLIGSGLLVWAAFMIRYAGVVLIPIGAAWLVVARPGDRVRRVRDAAIFGAVGAVVPVAWMLRNHGIDGTLLGVRYSSARGLVPNVFDTLATIGNFLVPGVAIEQRKIWAVVGLAGIAVVAVLLWRVLRSDERGTSLGGAVELLGTTSGLLVVHVVVYTLYMLYARTTTGLNQLDFRLLNPLYLPLVLFALVVADRVLTRSPTPEASLERLARGSVLAWSALSVLIGLASAAYFVTDPDLFSGNYEREAFVTARSTPVFNSMYDRCDRSPETLSSNLPNALYERGIEADWSPRLTGLESTDKVDDLLRLGADVSKRRHCIIWLDLEPTYGHLATLAQLREHFTLDEVGHDGVVTVYAVRPLGARR